MAKVTGRFTLRLIFGTVVLSYTLKAYCISCILVWTKIAPHMPGRTDNMVLQRYKRLLGWKEMADLSEELPVSKIDCK